MKAEPVSNRRRRTSCCGTRLTTPGRCVCERNQIDDQPVFIHLHAISLVVFAPTVRSWPSVVAHGAREGQQLILTRHHP